MPCYRAFGTTIETDVPLPALRGSAVDGDEGSPGIRVTLRPPPAALQPPTDETEWHRSVPDDAGHVLRVTRNDAGDFRFVYTDGTQFVIAADGTSVTASWPPELTLEDTSEYLLGPVIGFALRRRGVVCLHASAVAVDDACFAILAPAGHGKSTTAAACARLGLPVLTDDVLALSYRDGRFWVLPSYPRVRLWPEAVAGLFGTADALPRLTPENESWHKRYLDLRAPGYGFQSDPLPLRCVYLPARDECATLSFETLKRPQALVQLLGNVYSLSRPELRQRAREFDFLERMARSIPVKRLRGWYGMDHVTDRCRALVQDCLTAPRGIPATAASGA
jgi:hypothetical protein